MESVCDVPDTRLSDLDTARHHGNSCGPGALALDGVGMKTPAEVIDDFVWLHETVGGAPIVQALDAAGYVIVRKGDDSLSPEMAEKIAGEAVAQVQEHNTMLNPLRRPKP